MITTDEFYKLSSEDSLWRVMVTAHHDGCVVIRSRLNSSKYRDLGDVKAVEMQPEMFFLDKNEADIYAEELTILLRLQR